MGKNKKGFNKLLPATIIQMKKQGTTIAICAVALIVMGTGKMYLSTLIEQKESTASQAAQTLASIQASKDSMAQKEYKLASLGSISSRMIDQSEFTKFLGRSAEVSGVSIVRLHNGPTLTTDSVMAINFQFELRGNIPSINQIVKAIDSLGAVYNIKQMSLRKDGEYMWLGRPFDQKAESWFQFGPDSTVPVQNIPLPQSLPEVVLDSKGEIIEIKDSRLTGVSDLLSGDRINLFADISFLIAR